MSMSKWILALAVLAVPLLAGCSHTTMGVRPNDQKVLHQHSDSCGHYYHDGRWYWVMDHHHGVACGHHFYNGQWNLNPPVGGFTTHVRCCPSRATDVAPDLDREDYQHPRQRGYHTYWR